MKDVRIFVLVKDSLYTVGDFEKPEKTAYEVVTDKWQDTEHLEDYFERYKEDLQKFHPNMSVERAVRKTLFEMMEFDGKLFNAANKKKLGKLFFKPLHKSDNHEAYIDSKAYGPDKKSWLRLYAIRLAVDIYVITGGGIKLTKAMTTDELKKELENLNKVKQFLVKEGMIKTQIGESGYLELKID